MLHPGEEHPGFSAEMTKPVPAAWSPFTFWPLAGRNPGGKPLPDVFNRRLDAREMRVGSKRNDRAAERTTESFDGQRLSKTVEEPLHKTMPPDRVVVAGRAMLWAGPRVMNPLHKNRLENNGNKKYHELTL